MSCSLLLTLLFGKSQIERIANAKRPRTVPNTIIPFNLVGKIKLSGQIIFKKPVKNVKLETYLMKRP